MATTEVLDPLTAGRLNAVEWHDSVLLSLQFDRARARRDYCRLHLLVLSDASRWESEEWHITLTGCRTVRMTLNGGVECLSEGEMIDVLEIQDGGALVAEVQGRWSGTSLPPLGQLKLRLASTGSVLSVVFESLHLSRGSERRMHPAPPRRGPTQHG